MRFPEFQGEWKETTIGRECDILCGYAFDGNDILESSGNVMLLRGINISEGFIRHSEEVDRFYSGDISKLYKYLLKEGDLVISMDGSKVGRNSAILTNCENDSYLIQRVCRIRSNKQNIRYVFQYVNNPKFHKYVDSVKTASAIPHISQSDIQNYSILIPPTKEEQDKVTRLLTLLDERISTQNKIIDKLESLIKALNDKLLCCGKDNNPSLRFSEFSDCWRERRIEEVGEVIGGGTPDTSTPEYWNGNINWFVPSEIGKQKYVSVSTRTISKVGLENSSAKLLTDGTILLSTRATIGEKSILKGSGCTNQGFQSICVNCENDNHFVFYILDNYKSEMISKASGSTFLEISSSNLKKIKIMLPSHSEQKKIAHFLSAIDDRIDTERKIQEKYVKQKGFLSYNLFI